MNSDTLLSTMFVLYLERIRDHLTAAISEVEAYLPEDTPRAIITKYVGGQKAPFDFSFDTKDYVDVPEGRPLILSNLDSLLEILVADIEKLSGGRN